jgi:hypothetical protein
VTVTEYELQQKTDAAHPFLPRPERPIHLFVSDRSAPAELTVSAPSGDVPARAQPLLGYTMAQAEMQAPPLPPQPQPEIASEPLLLRPTPEPLRAQVVVEREAASAGEVHPGEAEWPQERNEGGEEGDNGIPSGLPAPLPLPSGNGAEERARGWRRRAREWARPFAVRPEEQRMGFAQKAAPQGGLRAEVSIRNTDSIPAALRNSLRTAVVAAVREAASKAVQRFYEPVPVIVRR